MKERIEKLRLRIDSMTLRERALLFVSTIALLYFLAQGLLFSPLNRSQNTALSRISSLQNESAAFDAQIQQILRRQTEDPDAADKRLQQQLEAQLATLDKQIDNTVHGLITPRQMAKVLEQVLQHQGNLRLVHIESLPAKPLIEPPADKPETNAGIYKHGLRLEFEGDYLSALAYLKQIEALPWVLYWDELELQTEKYPRTHITVVVHTLSLKEGWIGV